MGLLAIAAALVLGGAQDGPPPEDLWVKATPAGEVADPCDGEAGQNGTSQAWIRTVMLERHHPRPLVCGDRTGLDDEAVRAAENDRLDLTAQASARLAVLMGAMSRSLDDDGSWGQQSEAAGRALYLALKADDYRLLRQTAAQEAAADTP
ncbi:hypothetical protein [Brevundimonas sp. NIBR11]|uniref:hypothetical protein n=1 Tax=Brevundimonas sp. NIBR11 TaxID=3015999 RepID=UPI0022F1160A|nr:hypothetical protein [Brevundimonas sp. NIBR11]WGM31794.1 hypothetical protein KKHFBJBL_02043 [Brevundimonas sp. NIBR11]